MIFILYFRKNVLWSVPMDDGQFVDATDQTYATVPVGSAEVAERNGGSSNGKTWELVSSWLYSSLAGAC